MHWCFAIVNNRLAEIHFKKGERLDIFGHCYVQVSEYKTKIERDWIAKDTKQCQFVYRKGRYRRVSRKV